MITDCSQQSDDDEILLATNCSLVVDGRDEKTIQLLMVVQYWNRCVFRCCLNDTQSNDNKKSRAMEPDHVSRVGVGLRNDHHWSIG